MFHSTSTPHRWSAPKVVDCPRQVHHNGAFQKLAHKNSLLLSQSLPLFSGAADLPSIVRREQAVSCHPRPSEVAGQYLRVPSDPSASRRVKHKDRHLRAVAPERLSPQIRLCSAIPVVATRTQTASAVHIDRTRAPRPLPAGHSHVIARSAIVASSACITHSSPKRCSGRPSDNFPPETTFAPLPCAPAHGTATTYPHAVQTPANWRFSTMNVSKSFPLIYAAHVRAPQCACTAQHTLRSQRQSRAPRMGFTTCTSVQTHILQHHRHDSHSIPLTKI
jgi:hypothetical protein